MNLEEQDLIDLRKAGAKIISKGGGRQLTHPPPMPPPQQKVSQFGQIVVAIRQLADALLALARRPNPESVVNVSAPKVTVSPAINVVTPTKWRVEITERDSAQRLKCMTIEANSSR